MNCIDWYTAYAFCIWDGGRLASEAEWNFAAAGGSEQRYYPWGDASLDPTLASYGCTEGVWDGGSTCPLSFLPAVGSHTAGDGPSGTATSSAA